MRWPCEHWDLLRKAAEGLVVLVCVAVHGGHHVVTGVVVGPVFETRETNGFREPDITLPLEVLYELRLCLPAHGVPLNAALTWLEGPEVPLL